MPACEGLPDTPCPYKAKGKEVKFRYAELDLCPYCESTRREINGAPISETLIEETKKQKRAKSINKTEGQVYKSLHNGSAEQCDSPYVVCGYNNVSEDDDVTLVKTNNDIKRKNSQELFLQPLISYILYAFQSGSFESIKIAVMGHFPLQQIVQAKNELWDYCGVNILGEKSGRKNTSSRTEAEAHTVDILNAIVKLDKCGKLPVTVIDSSSLGLIPRSHPEELNNITLCDRLSRLEAKLQHLQTNLDENICRNLVLEQNVQQIASNTMSYAGAVREMSNSKNPDNSLLAADKRTMVSLEKVQSNSSGTFTLDAVKTKASALITSGQSNKQSSVGMLSKDPGSDDGFLYPSEQLRRKRRMESRKKIIRGNASSSGSVRGGPEPDRHLFIFRVDKSTDIEELNDYIAGHGFTVRCLERVSNPEAKFQSFRLTVPLPEYGKLFEASLWPEGIGIRKFVLSKKDFQAQLNMQKQNS